MALLTVKKFNVQVILSFVVMAFCIYMIASNNQKDRFFDLMIMIMVYWLPSPKEFESD